MENLDVKMESFDQKLINLANRWSLPFSRFAIFLVYFWFGALKLCGQSPANPLVAGLLERMLPGIPFSSFIIFLGVFEMTIASLFIFKGAE
ncbi:hypothetical protein K2P96_01635 [Patescibacteria group bacterium]|nr:hypothetical protein [Patescibacteria group bacterium]